MYAREKGRKGARPALGRVDASAKCGDARKGLFWDACGAEWLSSEAQGLALPRAGPLRRDVQHPDRDALLSANLRHIGTFLAIAPKDAALLFQC